MEESIEDRENRLRSEHEDYMFNMRKLNTYKENAINVLKAGLKFFSTEKKDYVYDVKQEILRYDLQSIQPFVEEDWREQKNYWAVGITIERRENKFGGSLFGTYSYYATLVLVFNRTDPEYKYYEFFISYDNKKFKEFGAGTIHENLKQCANVIAVALTKVPPNQTTTMISPTKDDDELMWHAINRLAQVIEDIHASRKI